jgi:Ca-activated chloride channel family protein
MSGPSFTFANPIILLLLGLAPLYYWRRIKTSNPLFLKYSATSLFDNSTPTWRQHILFLPSFLRLLALCFLIIALARPQSVNKTTEVSGEGVDIMLTLDTSGSMKALDFHMQGLETNRLDVIKQVVDDFISHREYDRIGMVVFGDEAYTQSPLTVDKDTLRMFLDWVHIGIVGDGTAIGNALATSVKRLKDQPTKSKVIILLTDGRNNAGEVSPLQAAKIAKEFNIKVYTIGVGSTGLVPYPEETPFGVRKVYARLDIDEDTLKQIADITGGKFFRATDTEELKQIYSTIDKLEKSEIKTKEYKDYLELFPFFVICGLFLLVTEVLLDRVILIRIP